MDLPRCCINFIRIQVVCRFFGSLSYDCFCWSGSAIQTNNQIDSQLPSTRSMSNDMGSLSIVFLREAIDYYFVTCSRVYRSKRNVVQWFARGRGMFFEWRLWGGIICASNSGFSGTVQEKNTIVSVSDCETICCSAFSLSIVCALMFGLHWWWIMMFLSFILVLVMDDGGVFKLFL